MSDLLIIDNTRSAGNFFDNLLNDEMIVTEYDIDNIQSISLDDNDKVVINTYLDYYDDPRYNFIDKYDYINAKTYPSFKTDEYENLYNELYKKMFLLTKSQYKQYYDFVQDHKKCLNNNESTIGGRICLEYHIRNTEDSPIVFDCFVKCNYCDDIIKLEDNFKEDKSENYDKKLLDSYELFIKYGTYFNKIEFYRFMEIYNDYKDEEIIVSFTPTGLGNLINIKTKEFIYNITDIDSF